jgi:hypothetical protein
MSAWATLRAGAGWVVVMGSKTLAAVLRLCRCHAWVPRRTLPLPSSEPPPHETRNKDGACSQQVAHLWSRSSFHHDAPGRIAFGLPSD